MSNFIENIRFYPDVEGGGTYLVTGFPGELLAPFFDTFSDDILDDLSRLSHDLRSDLFIFRGGIGCAPKVYTSEDGSINWNVIRRLYTEENATIYLRACQRYLPEIKKHLGEIAKVLPGTHLFANLFLTPPESVGLKPHLDPTEFFVLQLGGAKIWHFWKQPGISELKGMSLKERAQYALQVSENEARTDVIDLRAGQVMYVPRFKIHGPLSAHSASAHITIGLATESMKEYYD